MKRCGCIASLLFLLNGCASQDITVQTEPAGASCTLLRNNAIIGTIASTPATISLERSSEDIIVSCIKEGYQKAEATDKASYNVPQVSGGNGGGELAIATVGAGVNYSIGGLHEYDDDITLHLVPLTGK